MNWLDIVLLVLAVLAIITGLRIGLIRAVLSLGGLIVGVTLAGRFYAPLSGLLSFIPQPKIAGIAAFAIILSVVMIATSILAKVLEWTASAIKLGWVNRLGGAVLGLVLAALVYGSLLAIWVKFFGAAQVISQSKLAVMLLDRFPAVLVLLPPEFDEIRSFFR